MYSERALFRILPLKSPERRGEVVRERWRRRPEGRGVRGGKDIRMHHPCTHTHIYLLPHIYEPIYYQQPAYISHGDARPNTRN